MKNILILNGPNLNLLGKREPHIYGDKKFSVFFEELKDCYRTQFNLSYFQSNIEGELINKIQESENNIQGLIINAGAYTHTSIAIRDAIASSSLSTVEVHISNIFARESFRKESLLAEVCNGSISGFGLKSYNLAVFSFS